VSSKASTFYTADHLKEMLRGRLLRGPLEKCFGRGFKRSCTVKRTPPGGVSSGCSQAARLFALIPLMEAHPPSGYGVNDHHKGPCEEARLPRWRLLVRMVFSHTLGEPLKKPMGRECQAGGGQKSEEDQRPPSAPGQDRPNRPSNRPSRNGKRTARSDIFARSIRVGRGRQQARAPSPRRPIAFRFRDVAKILYPSLARTTPLLLALWDALDAEEGLG